MAQDIISPEPTEAEILLSFQTEEPISAAAVGELLSALSRDYRQMNKGRTLSVSRLQTGSLLLYLADAYTLLNSYGATAVEFAKGGKAILDFAKAIRDEIKSKKDDHAEDHRARLNPHRSVEAIVKIAAETGSELRLQHTSVDGSSFNVELTPAEAVRIREHTRFVQQEAKRLRHEQRLSLPPSTKGLADLRVGELADRVARLGLPKPESSDSLIGTIVRLLRDTGNHYIVEMLAQELATRGQFDLAHAVRAEDHRDEREPPLTER